MKTARIIGIIVAAKDTDAMADGFLKYISEHLPDANTARI